MVSTSVAFQFHELAKYVVVGKGDKEDDRSTIDVERCTELLESIKNEIITVPQTSSNNTSPSSTKNNTISIVKKVLFGTTSDDIENEEYSKKLTSYIHILDCAQRTFRSMKRSCSNNDSSNTTRKQQWEDALTVTKQIGRVLVDIEETIQRKKKRGSRTEQDDDSPRKDESTSKKPNNDSSGTPEYPKSVVEYTNRLKKQQKEIYKDPPVLPPPIVVIEEEYITNPPTRNNVTKRLQFEPSANQQKQGGKDLVQIFRTFQPNTTPAEILQKGSFGGTYFRPIVSAVTNKSYNNTDYVLATTVDPTWIEGLNKSILLTSSTYREHVNLYKVKCGGSLGMWESSGWISTADPYGWFQWYCRFYQGRRSSDDVRQIKRWLGVAGTKGRFKSQLCNKILLACPKGSAINNTTISPVIRQTLFHWGLVITQDILQEHIQNKK